MLALALCHNVTPVYEDEEGEDAGESDIPEADQERNGQGILRNCPIIEQESTKRIIRVCTISTLWLYYYNLVLLVWFGWDTEKQTEL